MRFSDLVSVHAPPPHARAATREAIHTHSDTNRITDDPANNGLFAGMIDGRRAQRLRPSRRGFLRGALAATSAATAASFANLVGPARRVAAQTGVVGTYPRRLLTFCPPYNSGDDCQPGCGSSPICTDCCSSDGFFRNEPANGYSLYAGGCGDGDIADGWIWRFKGKCGSCSTIEYRCSDGYVQTDTGPAPFICRTVTECVPLGEGEEPGEELADAARPTNWKPAGALEVVIDNGRTVTMNGWISDGSGQPAEMRIRANGRIVHFGKAGLVRGDIQQRVAGAGPNTGYAVSFPLDPGDYELCIDALSGVLTSTIGCVNMAVGSGGSVRGPGEVGAPRPPAPDPTATPDSVADRPPAPEPTTAPSLVTAATVTGLGLSLPARTPASASATVGGLQILRRSGPDTGFASGWAGDIDTTDAVFIEVSVDGEPVSVARTELPRPDVQTAFAGLGPDCGFAITFPLPAESANVCVDAVGPDDGRRRLLGCRTLGPEVIAPPPDALQRPTATGAATAPAGVIYGSIESVEVSAGEVLATGWAFTPAEPTQSVVVAIETGSGRSESVADMAHADVARIYGIDGAHGFSIRVPSVAGQEPLRLIARVTDGSEVILDERILETS